MNCRNSLLQKFLTFNYLPMRMCVKLPEGIKYTGFTYYPRSENFQDPPYEPSKLFLVKRCKSIKGTNDAEKNALKSLSIFGKKSENGHIAVVKNTPSTNAHLWKVKHLVEIRPITWKGDLPKDDLCGTFLRETGELVISPKLKVTPEQLKLTEKMYSEQNSLTRRYLKAYLKKKWNEGFSGSV